MCTQSCLKNKYIESRRNYLDDYSNNISKEIDMTMSGKYIGEYPNFKLDINSIDLYPSFEVINNLKNAIRKKFNIKREIVIGTGANGILQNLIKLFFVNGGNLVTPYYSFNQAEYAVTSLGGTTRRVFTDGEDINFDYILESIDDNTKLVYICNPNNPTGIFIPTDKLLEQVKRIDNNIPIVIDESAIEFSDGKSLFDYEVPDNIIILRTFSKAYGLANLRIGYMSCCSKYSTLYDENITVNEVSGLSCCMATQSIESDLYKTNVEKIISERERLIKELDKMGINMIKSCSNTIFSSSTFDRVFLDKLLDNEISVVEVEDPFAGSHIRIAVQDVDTNNRFLNKIKSILES